MTTLTEPIPSSLVNEINLIQYLAVLRRRWLWIAGCAFLGALAAFLFTYLAPRVYLARTELAIVRTGTIVTFDPKFRTVSDTDPNAQGLDTVARRRSLVTIGSSPGFTLQVIDQLGTLLPEELRDPAELQRSLSVASDGDVIRVSVLSDNPELAALIANTWASIYVKRVNEVFAEGALTTDTLETQAVEAKKDYEAKESALVADIQSTPLERLKRQQDTLIQQLNSLGNLEAKLFKLEDDAQSLKTLIQRGQGAASLSDEFARFTIEANSFNNAGELPARVDLPLANATGLGTREQQLQQLDALIKTFQERRAAIGGSSRDELYKQLNDVQVEIEKFQQVRKELNAARDLAWDTYQLLNSKVAENTVASQTESQLVRIAAAAIVPTEPMERRVLLTTILGGMAGAVVGACLALFLRVR